MNRATYEKYYPDGDIGFDNDLNREEINSIRYQNLQDFLDENPSVIPLNKDCTAIRN